MRMQVTILRKSEETWIVDTETEEQAYELADKKQGVLLNKIEWKSEPVVVVKDEVSRTDGGRET
jgi:hypothetical protein